MTLPFPLAEASAEAASLAAVAAASLPRHLRAAAGPAGSRCAERAQPRALLLQLDLGSSRAAKLRPGPSPRAQGHELPCAQDAGPCQPLPLGTAPMGEVRTLRPLALLCPLVAKGGKGPGFPEMMSKACLG